MDEQKTEGGGISRPLSCSAKTLFILDIKALDRVKSSIHLLSGGLMSLYTVVSYDADAIRVVTADKTKYNLTLKRTLTLSDNEFELFLASDRSKSYQIIINSPDAIYEVVNIPPVEARFNARIIDTELRRMHPESANFSFAYRIIGELVQDGRTVRRVACCMISNELLDSFLEPFVKHNKPVHIVATAPQILATMVAGTSTELPNILLCGYDEGMRKTLFIIEGRAVLFSRQIPSDGRDWNQFDKQNVTMTLDYCFQSLRIRPGGAIAINCADPSPPFVPFSPSIAKRFSEDSLLEYPAQLAILNYPFTASDDLRPKNYRLALKEQELVRYAGYVFALATVVVMLLLAIQAGLIAGLKNSLEKSRQPTVILQGAIDSFQSVTEQRNKVEDMIAVLNRRNAEPTIPDLLAALDLSGVEGVTIASFSSKRDKDSISILFNGTINAKTLSGSQACLEELVKRLALVKGISIASKHLDTNNHKFTLEGRYSK